MSRTYKINGNTFRIAKRNDKYRVHQQVGNKSFKEVRRELPKASWFPSHFPETSYETLSGAAYGLLCLIQEIEKQRVKPKKMVQK